MSPLNNSPSRLLPAALSVAPRRTLNPLRMEEVISLGTQLVVSAINHHSLGITGSVSWTVVRLDMWPRFKCSLGYGRERPHRTGGDAAQHKPKKQTGLSSTSLPSIASWIPVGGLGARNNYNYVECVLS